MKTPIVDVVVAVHRSDRPVERAVSSVLSANAVPCRVIVVAHNTPAQKISNALGKWAQDPRVKLVELQDGIHSPSGPMNLGLDNATAKFVSLLGSDDELEQGAIDRWVSIAEAPGVGADFVIANRLEPDSHWANSPPVRLGRRRRLQGAADRLAYRAAPLGLWRRSTFGELRFDEGVQTGEDISFSAGIWFSGARIAFAYGSPGYRVHADQDDRVTTTARSVNDDLGWVPSVLAAHQPWMTHSQSRRALIVKLLRRNVLDALSSQLRQGWSPTARRELSNIVGIIAAADPRALGYLSIYEADLLGQLMAGQLSATQASSMLRKAQTPRSLRNLISVHPHLSLSSQAPLPYHFAGLALRVTEQIMRHRKKW